MRGSLTTAMTSRQIADRLHLELNREPLLHAVLERPVTELAWCTGGGQSYIEQAYASGAELFISGEVSEQTIHSSRELGIDFIAAGHHATERYGIQALAEFVQQKTGVLCEFIDIDNPA